VALHIDDAPGRGDIWVTDLERSTTQRLTFAPERHNATPVWRPDGQRLIFSKGTGALGIYDKDAGGVGDEQLVLGTKAAFTVPTSVSPAGALVLAQATADRRADLFAMSASQGTTAPIVSSPGMDAAAQVSPDGRWVAYESDQSGRTEVFIQSFPVPRTKLQVSTGGGLRPRWRRDSRELYYFPSGAGAPLTAVPVTLDGEGLRLGKPVELFSTRVINASHDAPYFGYVPSPDGQRFLVARPLGVQGSGFEAALTVVLNWQAALR
jgi:Tol biopolymer transport system component